MSEEIGSLAVRIGLDSSGFQDGVGAINRQLKVLESEFKKNTAALGTNAKGIEGLKVKAESLSKTMEMQKQRVVALETAYQRSAETKGKDAKATQELEIKLNNARAALSRTETALSETTREIDKQSDKWVQLGEKVEAAGNKMKDIGGKMTSVGKTLTMSITAPIIGLGAAAVNAGMDFEAGMSRVKAISGATTEEFAAMNDQALQLGADTAFSASEAAAGMENLVSAGFTASQTMDAMPGMLSLAASGGVEVADAADIAASALNGFGLEAGSAGHVADVLASAASQTNAGVTDMGYALKYAAPSANALGLSLEEVSAAVGVMSDAGIKGEQAGTTLRGAFTRLVKPSDDAAGKMKELGINAFDSNGKMKPLADVIGNVKSSMSGLTDEQRQNAIATIFGQEAMSGILTLIDKGPDKLNTLTTSFKNSSGAAKEMADISQDNLKGSVEAMKGSLENAGIKITIALAPAIKAVADGIGKLADAFANLPVGAQTSIMVVLGLAAVLGPLLMIIGGTIAAVGTISVALAGIGGIAAIASGALAVLGGAFAFLISPLGLAIAAGVLIIANWGAISKAASSLATSATGAFKSLGSGISNAIKGAADFIGAQVARIKSFFSGLKISIPAIKLPHFTMTGKFSLNPPSIPSIGVNWYDKGGVFNSPSVIGVGEKRPEFVGALDDLRKIVREEAGGGKGGNNIEVNINNPVAETGSESTRKQLTRLAYMGVF